MSENTTKETVGQVLDLLLGEANGDNGRLTSAVREQIMPQVEQRVNGLEESIQLLREAHAKGPPSNERRRYGPAPWNAAADALGLPDASWHNPDAPGAALDGKFESFGDYVKAVIRRDLRGVADDRLLDVGEKGMSAALTGEEIELGGALVPEEFRPVLLSGTLSSGNIRPRAMTIPMGSGSIVLPAIRDDDHSNGTVFGGVKFEWLEAGDEIAESDPDFKTVTLNARALAGRTVLPNTLLEDSFITVPALIMQLYQQAVPWVEEGVFIRGDGAGKPQGVINSPAAVSVSRATASEFDVKDVFAMESHLMPGSGDRAMWVIHPQVKTQLGQLNAGSVQSWHPALSAAMPDTLNGRPIMYTEHASGLGVKGDVMLIDWMYYLIGDRQALSMMASPHERFSRNQTVIRAIERIDGAPWIDTAITPAQRSGTTYQMSPFVVLDVP